MYLRPTRTYGSIIPGSETIRDLVLRGRISEEGSKRLRWMDHYARHGNARLTCRHFDISAQTFYRWKNRFDPEDLTTLEAESRRPQHVRKPLTPAPIQDRILELRMKYPRWGKDKLVVLLRREGIQVSTSTVGRVMKRLRDRGVLVEPINVRRAQEARKRRRRPRYAIRKPEGYRVTAPGDLRYPSDPPPGLRPALAVQLPGPHLPLGCLPSLSERLELRCRSVPRVYGTQVPLPGPGHPDRWWLGVQEALRRGLPDPGDPSLHYPASNPKASGLCRECQQDPSG